MHCHVCGAAAKAKCGRCNRSAYCGKECATLDWEKGGHRRECFDTHAVENELALAHEIFMDIETRAEDLGEEAVEDANGDHEVTLKPLELDKELERLRQSRRRFVKALGQGNEEEHRVRPSAQKGLRGGAVAAPHPEEAPVCGALARDLAYPGGRRLQRVEAQQRIAAEEDLGELFVEHLEPVEDRVDPAQTIPDLGRRTLNALQKVGQKRAL